MSYLGSTSLTKHQTFHLGQQGLFRRAMLLPIAAPKNIPSWGWKVAGELAPQLVSGPVTHLLHHVTFSSFISSSSFRE